MCLKEVFEVDVDNPDHRAKYGSPLSLQVSKEVIALYNSSKLIWFCFVKDLFSGQSSASVQRPEDTQKADKLKNEGGN